MNRIWKVGDSTGVIKGEIGCGVVREILFVGGAEAAKVPDLRKSAKQKPRLFSCPLANSEG